MSIGPSTIPPNLTSIKLRRGGNLHPRRYQVDPAWGIPEGTPPLSVDPTTGMVRPFSSFVTLATAIDNFVGFSWQFFHPGENHTTWVELEGWVEMILQTPSVIVTGEYYTGVVVSGAVSNDLVVPTTLNAPGIFRAVDSCECQPFFGPIDCPVEAAEASDVSPTAEASPTHTQRTVLLYFHSDLQTP